MTIYYVSQFNKIMANNRQTVLRNLYDNNLLLEFEYNSAIYPLATHNFLRVINNQFRIPEVTYCSYNPDMSEQILRDTNNTINNLIQIDTTNNRFVNTLWTVFSGNYKIRIFEQLLGNVVFTSPFHLQEQFPAFEGINILYNKIRVYVLQGYNFDDINNNGFIVRCYYEDQDLKRVFVTQNAYLKEDRLKYLAKPERWGSRIFDRVFEITIPNLRGLHQINNVFEGTTEFQDLPSEDTAVIKIDIQGIRDTFIADSGIRKIVSNLPFTSDDILHIALQLDGDEDGIGCVIRESLNGDYFEFFATYNGEFISDYIFRNPQFANPVIFHEINVIEHTISPDNSTGAYNDEVSQSVTFIQGGLNADAKWSQPLIFRPVVMNTSAVAVTLEYRMTFNYNSSGINVDNNESGQQIVIRRATLTIKDGQKYGRNLQRIYIDNFKINKIVNKIVNNNNIESEMTETYPSIFGNQLFNSFNMLRSDLIFPINMNNLMMDVKNIPNGQLTKITELNIQKFNEATLNLERYGDNYINIKIFHLNNEGLIAIYPINRNNTIFYQLELIDENNETIQIAHNFPFTENVINRGINSNLKLGPNDLFFSVPRTMLKNLTDNGNFIIKMTNVMTTYLNSEEIQQIENFEMVLGKGIYTIS